MPLWQCRRTLRQHLDVASIIGHNGTVSCAKPLKVSPTNLRTVSGRVLRVQAPMRTTSAIMGSALRLQSPPAPQAQAAASAIQSSGSS
jgi:hypothetical protein